MVLASVLFTLGCGDAPVRFVVMADLHLRPDRPQRTQRFEAAIRLVNRIRPLFVVICGDLVDLPDQRVARELFHEAVERLDDGIGLHVAAGNHDVGMRPTSESVDRYRANFGPDWYRFDYPGITGVVLDSAIVKNAAEVGGEVAAQLEWLGGTLRDAARTDVSLFVFMHHPPFFVNPREGPSKYTLPRGVRRPYVDLFRVHGVRGVFAGHAHRNQQSTATEPTVIVTASTGRASRASPPGISVVTVSDGVLEIETLEIAPEVAAVESSDP